MSQIDFAAFGGAKKHSQINYEADRTAPGIDYLYALGEHGVDIVYVLTGERGVVRALPNGGFEVRDVASDLAQLAIQAQTTIAAEFCDQASVDAEGQSAGLKAADTSHGTFVEVPVFSAELAAGDGTENGVDAIVDHLAFRRDWLQKMQVSPSAAVIARAWGDSMWPTLQPGDLLLIDRGHAEPPSKIRTPGDTRPAPIYALLDDGRARVKRIERVSLSTLMLLSDNPASPPEVRPISTVSIIGRVVWWGHTNRE